MPRTPSLYCLSPALSPCPCASCLPDDTSSWVAHRDLRWNLIKVQPSFPDPPPPNLLPSSLPCWSWWYFHPSSCSDLKLVVILEPPLSLKPYTSLSGGPVDSVPQTKDLSTFYVYYHNSKPTAFLDYSSCNSLQIGILGSIFAFQPSLQRAATVIFL